METETKPLINRETKWAREYLDQQVKTLANLPWPQILKFIDMLKQARDAGKTVFVCGNGGSAANASHFATDLGYVANRKGARGCRTISLADNTPTLTAIANDEGYRWAFREHLVDWAESGDVLVVLSVSGKSYNILSAISAAKAKRIHTVAITGSTDMHKRFPPDLHIQVPTTHFGRAEDAIMTILHIAAYYFIENVEGK